METNTHTYAYMLNTKPLLCQALLKQGKDTSGEESSFVKFDFELDVHPVSQIGFISLLLNYPFKGCLALSPEKKRFM